MNSVLQEIISKQAKEMQQQKEKVLYECLNKKGFGHLIEGIERKRFPKLCAVVKDGWEYWYADNNTDQGAFIVAFKDYEFNQTISGEDFSIKNEVFCTWQDTLPLVEYVHFKQPT